SEKGNTRTGFFDEQPFREVLTHLPDHLADCCLFDFLCGWRRKEIKTLAWEDVEGDTIRLKGINAKTGEPRMVVLEGELAELMARRKAARPVTTATGDVMLADLVFHHQGQPIGDFRKAWQTACVSADSLRAGTSANPVAQTQCATWEGSFTISEEQRCGTWSAPVSPSA